MTVTDGGRASLNDRVAAEVRAEMARRQISGRVLAGELGVSHSWVSYRLSGSQPIDFVDIEQIANALGVPVARLIPIAEPAGVPR